MNYPKEFTGAEIWHQHGVTGEGVVVAVIDTGVYEHKDLAVRSDGKAMESGDKPTDDKNPYGHGTHVAGIAAGAVYGVAPDAEVLPIKITKGSSNTSKGENLVNALKYVMEWHKENPKKRVVVNISFSNTHMPVIVDEINALVAEDIPVVVAACNDGDEKSPIAEYDSPIVVANLLNDSKMNSSSSCWGKLTDCCVIGSSVWSCKNAASGYRSLSGTSMASPAVAGMMALILSRWPDISEADAYKYLIDNATPAEVRCPSGLHKIARVELPDDFAAESPAPSPEQPEENPVTPDTPAKTEKAEVTLTYSERYVTGIPSGKVLVVRELLDSKSDKSGNARNGNRVRVLATSGSRALICTGEEPCGWVSTKYLGDENPVTSADADTVSITGDDDYLEDAATTTPVKVKAADMVAYYLPHAVVTNSKAGDNPPANQWGYVMGGDGRVATATYLVQRAKSSYPNNWERYVERTSKWLGRPVFDCNSLAEAYYKDKTGTSIDTKAKYNYSGWCGRKSPTTPDSNLTGLPQMVGTAVFSGNSASAISHVGYLAYKYGDGDLDWYVLEARGADYGVILTKLTEREWRWWGVMDKYFEYDSVDAEDVYYAKCTGNKVNVRKGRGTSYASIGKLNKGDIMLAMPAVDGWCEVSAKINNRLMVGYMSAQYVEGF